MKKLSMHIHNIKCINDVSIDLPIEPDLYAITGQNGSGKSTIVACASSVFFNLPMNDYFGETAEDAHIDFEIDGNTRSWKKVNHKWESSQQGNMNIRGFYEGSLIFGYRFKDTTFDKLRRSINIDKSKLHVSHEFIRENLGLILQGDKNYYEHLFEVSNKYEGFNGSIFYYEKNGRLVSQFHMSTGENLLISILNSLYIKNKESRAGLKNSIIFLDEIELALHPSSLKRLITFLRDMAINNNYAIYFSTHSIELVSGIKPENIFYVERYNDGTIGITNPCYPAFATRNLYNHDGYDKVVLVEDDLAKAIINRLLRDEQLLNSRLVHVLPCGGFTHVIDFAADVVQNNLLGRMTSICMIIDRDVRKDALKYKNSKGVKTPTSFLPVPSLEKYLRQTLFLNVDHALFKLLGDYLFQQRSLSEIISEYKLDKDSSSDERGKLLYRFLSDELSNRRKDRDDIIEIIVRYWFDNKMAELTELVDFLKKELP